MLQYRAYPVDEEGHILGPPILFECADDETAIKRAKQLARSHNVELWQGARMVATFQRLAGQ